MNKLSLTAYSALFAVLLTGCAKPPAAEDAPTQVETPNAAAAPASSASAPPAEAPAGFARDNPSGGNVKQVTVTATGEGPTSSAAASRAVLSAIEQVNGKSIDASTSSWQAGMAVALGESRVDVASASFGEIVRTRSRGAVTDFKVVSQRQLADGAGYEVTIEARVAKFVAPAAAQRLKISVAPIRSASSNFTVDTRRIPAAEVSRQLRENLIETLTQNERFAVLDRAFTAEIDAELDRIAEGRSAHQEISRLGQELAADYLLIARIDRFGYERHERELRTSEKVLVWHSGGATLTLRLVNVATGQLEQADAATITLPQTEPTTLGRGIDAKRITEDLIARLSERAAQNVVGRLFPVTIIEVNGPQVILSQGGKSLIEGQRYEVILRGKEIKDPQTGQSLGRREEPCCTVLVTKVAEQISYGEIAESGKDVAALFAPGALELRGVIPTPKAVTAQRPGADREDDADEKEPADATPAPKDNKNW